MGTTREETPKTPARATSEAAPGPTADDKRRSDRRSGLDRRFFPRPEGRRTADGRRASDDD